MSSVANGQLRWRSVSVMCVSKRRSKKDGSCEHGMPFPSKQRRIRGAARKLVRTTD